MSLRAKPSGKGRTYEGIERFNRVKPVTNALASLLFIVLALACVLPVVFVFIISISDESSILAKGYSFFPTALTGKAYDYLWEQKAYIGRAFFNSAFVTVAGTALGLVLCSTLGYALSRPQFRFKKVYTFYIFFPMLFSGGMVSSYMINSQVLMLKNTYGALILPIACSSFYIIMMRTFFQTTVPDSVIESAQLDGARQFRIFPQIVLPISLPAVATIGLFFTFAFWNNWMQAKLYLNTNRQDLFPLQYMLISIEENLSFLTRNAQNIADMDRGHISDSIRMAIVVVVVLPIACSYPFFQKYFISGLTIGAVKG